MREIEVVTASLRPDFEDEARAAFRPVWPEFIFRRHDLATPVTYITAERGRVPAQRLRSGWKVISEPRAPSSAYS